MGSRNLVWHPENNTDWMEQNGPVGWWGKLQNEELRDMCSSSEMRRLGHLKGAQEDCVQWGYANIYLKRIFFVPYFTLTGLNSYRTSSKFISSSLIKRDQLDVTCFIISLFSTQHVSDVNTSILRNLRLICWDISWVVLLWFDVCWCYVVAWLWWCGIRMQAEAVPQPACGYTHRTRAIQPMK